MNSEKERVIQEYVPGKQITLAHIIASPDSDLSKKLGLNEQGNEAIGILTITPCEAAIIAADAATKSGNIHIGFIDRFSGSLVIAGDVSSVENSIAAVLFLMERLQFSIPKITKS